MTKRPYQTPTCEIRQGKTPIKHVPKGWGYEKWIINTPLYCGKLLHVEEDKRCSMHYHLLKHECFYVVSGFVLLESILKDGSLVAVELKTGDSFVVTPGLMHRFTAYGGNADIIEFSTQHFDSDSYRVQKGD